jgi:hypothetical protein
MATSVAERNARLDALEKATKEWTDIAKKRFQEQVAISKAILRGRTGSDRLAESGVMATSDLLVQEIDDFLAT